MSNPASEKSIVIATRGSALALAQANKVLAACRGGFPSLQFELRIIKTSGDKLQTASMSQAGGSLPKGLFTKELENALLKGRADMAVHSLKDLPTELPEGLKLGGVGGVREDVRDVLIYRDEAVYGAAGNGCRAFKAGTPLTGLPQGATLATSSTRRAAQFLAIRPDFKIIPIRGNVATRMEKLARQPEMDATVLAAAGLARLNYSIGPEGRLQGEGVPEGLLAIYLTPEDVLPCVGQAAIGIEIRENDPRLESICERLNDAVTHRCVVAERALLRAMGGGCQTPMGAYAKAEGDLIRLQAVSFLGGQVRRVSMTGRDAISLGEAVAARIR
jgi:hydroxymethylbilane synthase